MAPSPGDAPTRNDRPWRYCALCGKPMEWRDRGQAFSRETGKSGRVHVWSCPSWTPRDSKHDRHDRTVHLS